MGLLYSLYESTGGELEALRRLADGQPGRVQRRLAGVGGGGERPGERPVPA